MIYCVEDDAGIRELVVYTLQNTGMEARGFADGTALFSALRSEKPDLILLDVMMPKMMGFAARRGRHLDPSPSAQPARHRRAPGHPSDREKHRVRQGHRSGQRRG